NGGAASTGWAADGPASATPRSYAWWSAACSKRPSGWACRPAPRSPPRIRRSTSSTWVSGTSPSAPTSPSCTSGGSPRARTSARLSLNDAFQLRHHPLGPAPLRHAHDVVEAVAESIGPVLHRRPGGVRRQDDVRQHEQRILGARRLLGHDVESGHGDSPRLQRIVERALVH